jgi:hypothetical protein
MIDFYPLLRDQKTSNNFKESLLFRSALFVCIFYRKATLHQHLVVVENLGEWPEFRR